MTTVVRIDLPTPIIGGKCWVLDRKGIFVLEEGPGVFRTCACTHFGTGSLMIFDGVPGPGGEFPPLPEIDDPDYGHAHGRPLYRADPSLMGSWMLDAGFVNGLTVMSRGGHVGVPTIASLVWLPYVQRSAPPKEKKK